VDSYDPTGRACVEVATMADTPTEQQVSNDTSAPADAEQVTGSDALWKNLSAGFTYLRALQDHESPDAPKPPPPKGSQAEHSYAVVNFVDPTASSGSAQLAPKPGGPKDLYLKVCSVFEKEYSSTLHAVPYQHIRSGAKQVIESLPVRPVLSGSQEGGSSIDIGDPSKWHNGPYCHVYIAACESLEHYKTKVKPSLQAFVSQIEAASNNYQMSSAAGVDASNAIIGSGNSYSAQYVILFVPTGDGSSQDAPRAVRRVGSAFASRVAAARQRMIANREISVDSAHNSIATDTTGSSEPLDNQDAVDNASTAVVSSTGMLSKVEKELLRRLNVDFPSGRVCKVTTLIEEPEEDDSEKEESSDDLLQKYEWTAFRRALGEAIVSGFRDRCQRYDEELKQLGSLRGAATASTADVKDGGVEFNLTHYFLIKESLAFTYEQMQLPSEALLTYNEVEALLPDARSNSSESKSENYSQLSEMALAGDTSGFRSQLRTLNALDPIADIIAKYMFARETHLLMLMGDAVKVVGRCCSFVETMFDIESGRSTSESSNSAEAERGAFEFCWNVKQACDCYLTSNPVAADSADEGTLTDKAFARQVSDLLDFARLRMLKLGDSLLPDGHPVRSKSTGLPPKDLLTAWEPWNPTTSSVKDGGNKGKTVALDAKSFLDEALYSSDTFQEHYLEFAKIVLALNSFSGRLRFSARLQMEMLDIYIRRGEKACAVEILSAISSVFAQDQWSACHFMLLFRVAGFQRLVGTPADYLKTLLDCFSDKLSAVAPSKALDMLHTDLMAVVGDSRVAGSRLAAPPLFGPALGLEGLKNPGTDRHLLKKLFTVGQQICFTMNLTSHLPKDIEVEGVAISLVSLQAFVASVEDDIPIKDEDVFRVLQLDSPVTISPGSNDYEYNWVPMSAGQLIVASVEINWRGTRIAYSARQMERSTIRVDIVPCEPTQSIEVRPVFLVAGQEQPVRIAFSAGTDIVEEGTIQLVCSPGLTLLPPGEGQDGAKWVGSCDIPLPYCAPGETIVLTPLVKGLDISESTTQNQSIHTLHAKISTSYRYAHADGLAAAAEVFTPPCMTSVLEAVVPTLGKPLLSVEGVEVIPFTSDRWMISVSLQCNTPVPFTIKSWKMNLTGVFGLGEDGDLNHSLVGTKIVAGEHLSFGFVCNLGESGTGNQSDKPSLLVTLEDEYETAFEELLSLPLKTPFVPKIKLGDLQSVPIKLTVSALEGVASSPVDLVYEIDTSKLGSLPAGSLLYAVDAESNDWILSGKVEGLINRDKASLTRLEFVAIPCRPGLLEQYPALNLSFLASEKDYGLTSLAASVVEPKPFYATCPTSHMTVAFPIGTCAP